MKIHRSSALLLPALLVLTLTLVSRGAPEPGQPASGWIELFDGKTLSGWVQRGGKARYSVEAGELVGSSVPGTGNSFLCTERDYTNFVLEVEFKVHEKLNSGIQFRSHSFDVPTEIVWNGKTNRVPANRVHGLQAEIDPSPRAWTAGIYEESARGWLCDLKTNDLARAAFRQGEWNRVRVECRGNHVKTVLNGVPAAELVDGRVSSGFIALQVHSVGKNEAQMEVRFRRVRIHPE